MQTSRDHDGKVRKLVEITQASEREAKQLLTASHGSLEAAMMLYYDQKPILSPQGSKRIKQLFDQYKDTKDIIDIDGMKRLCDDLKVEPTQLEFLVLSYHLKSPRLGEFTQQGFVEGCTKLRCDSIDSLREEIKKQTQDLATNDAKLREIYSYAFLFGQEKGQKNLSLAAAIELWQLLLGNRFDRIDQWINFLEMKKDDKSISRDTWEMFFDFGTQFDQALSNYDPQGAWPVLIDEFVEHINGNSK